VAGAEEKVTTTAGMFADAGRGDPFPAAVGPGFAAAELAATAAGAAVPTATTVVTDAEE
jgi:hypothetical protein